MKNLFRLSSLLFVGLVFLQVACSDDPPPAVDPLVGNWAMSGAIFNSTDKEPTDVLQIAEVPDGMGGTFTLERQSGESILDLVTTAMADGVCKVQENNTTFFLELTADGKLFLNCPVESVREDTGTWIRFEDPTAGTVITLIIITDLVNIDIVFTNFAMLGDGSKFTGQAVNFPMTQVFGRDLGIGNLQSLNTDMEFTRLP